MPMKTAVNYDPSERERFYPDSRENEDERSVFERDRSRIIHSTAFRRLQGKTQVFELGSSDFFRTRLTHSLEAAQIGKGIALDSNGKADTDLVESACLIHDIGHPPFGHAGEKVLHELMKDNGGFEGNAQNLRIIHRLEAKINQGGLNLTLASLDAILKYPWSYSEAKKKGKKKFYYDDDVPLVEWVKTGVAEPGARSVECQIMEWADDIAYSTHDLEDGLKSGMISYGRIMSHQDEIRKEVEAEGLEWDQAAWESILGDIQELSKQDNSFQAKVRRKEMISKLVGDFIHGITWKQRSDYEKFPSRYRYEMCWNPSVQIKCAMLKKLVWITIINDQRVAILEKKSSHIITTIFEELNDEGWRSKLLPPDFREMLAKNDSHRVVADYIAGMTDAHALKIYSRLRESDIHSIFDLL